MTEWDDMLAEELRPYRKLLTDKVCARPRSWSAIWRGTPRPRSQRVYGYLALAGSQHEAGEAAAARESGLKALELAEALLARDPSAESRELLGDGLPSAHRAWRTNRSGNDPTPDGRMRSSKRLAAAQPDQPNRNAHSIALNYHNIGDEYYSGAPLDEAIAAFDAGVRVCQEQIRRGDRSEGIQLDLGRNLLYLSRADRDAGRLDAAVDAGNRAVAVYRAILDREPGDYSCAIQLYLAHQEVSFAYQLLQRWDELIAATKRPARSSRPRPGHTAAWSPGWRRSRPQLAVVDFNLSLGLRLGRPCAVLPADVPIYHRGIHDLRQALARPAALR